MRALPALLLLTGPALAQEASSFAGWYENAGALPPEFSWEMFVTYYGDGTVEVSYCRGYADAPPGCAVETQLLPPDALQQLKSELASLTPGLLEDPPQADPMPPVGGPARIAWLNVEGEDLHLPYWPIAEDREQVDAVLKILQATTPPDLVSAAIAKAKAP